MNRSYYSTIAQSVVNGLHIDAADQLTVQLPIPDVVAYLCNETTNNNNNNTTEQNDDLLLSDAYTSVWNMTERSLDLVHIQSADDLFHHLFQKYGLC